MTYRPLDQLKLCQSCHRGYFDYCPFCAGEKTDCKGCGASFLVKAQRKTFCSPRCAEEYTQFYKTRKSAYGASTGNEKIS
jgi:hypothetical protein